MTRFSLNVVWIVSISTLLVYSGTGLALDEGGCLTCHQYHGSSE